MANPPARPPVALTRRSLLAGAAGAAGALVLAACGGDDGESTPTTGAGGTTTAPSGDGIVLGEAFDRNALLVAGIEQRAAFLLFRQSGGLLRPEEAPDALTFTVETDAGDAVGTVEVARHGDGIERAYYPLVLTFPAPGIHTVRADVEGTAAQSQVAVNDRSTSTVPQVGDPMPAPVTPTTAAPGDATTLCTQEPPCPFHEASLDALVGTSPVAFLVSTPAYCNTAICGPVLDLLQAEAPGRPGLTLVHLEVYPFGAPPDAGPTPLVSDPFGLSWEPALLVADAGGTVTARLDNVWDQTELAAALATVG